MKKYLLLSVITAAFLISGTVSPVYGHGDEGLEFEKVVGGYTVDVDADALVLQADQPVRFSFNIEAQEQEVEFTDVWVRITPKGSFGTVFAGDIRKSELGATGMTFTFPHGGEYELSVRFQNNGERIADEASFPLVVENSPNDSKTIFTRDLLIGLFLGTLIAFAAGFFLKKKK